MATAWGEIEISVGTMGAGEIMGASLTSVGNLKEDSVSMETSEGTPMQLFGSGHVLIDEQGVEPELRINAQLIGNEGAKQFWTMGTAENAGNVISLVKDQYLSVKMASKVVGSDTFEAPKCKIKATPQFGEKEGFNPQLVITVLKGEADYLYKIGTVAGS